jgi:Protein of unknown function (DUF2917)
MEQEMKSATPLVSIIELGPDQLKVLDGGGDSRLRVLSGTAWLTQEGEPGDAVLARGDELPLRSGRTLIQALQTARVQLSVRPASPWAALGMQLRKVIARLHLGPAAPEPLG